MGVISNMVSAMVPAAYAAGGKTVGPSSDISQVMGQMEQQTDVLQQDLIGSSLLLVGSSALMVALLVVYFAVPLIVWKNARQNGVEWCSAARKGAFAGLVAVFVINILAIVMLFVMSALGIDGGYAQFSGAEVVKMIVQMVAIAVCAYFVRISDAKDKNVGLVVAIVTLVLCNLVAGILLIIAWNRARKAEAVPAMFQETQSGDGTNGEGR